MEKSVCSICQKPKAPYICGACAQPLCKKCAHFLDEDQFSFYKTLPELLTKGIFCHPCFLQNIEPEIATYDEIMARAREVYVFNDEQNKESRAFSRVEAPLHVKDCPDRNETLLRLAFYAAQAGFNGLVDVSISSEKVRNAAFQKLIWHGSGVPTHIDPSKLNKNKSFL